MSSAINVKKRNGRLEKLDTNKINLCAERPVKTYKMFQLVRSS